jgi:hypothetical protein
MKMGFRDWKPKVQRVFGKTTEIVERGLYRANLRPDYSAKEDVKFVGTVWEPEKIALSYMIGEPPNLIGSKVVIDPPAWQDNDGVYHAPVIDLDIPVRLVESATPNHYHLYIDKLVSKEHYLNILKALNEAGLVQDGFQRMMDEHDQTFVRWGVLKGQEETI